jgi:hypothetical protein
MLMLARPGNIPLSLLPFALRLKRRRVLNRRLLFIVRRDKVPGLLVEDYWFVVVLGAVVDGAVGEVELLGDEGWRV